MWSFNRDGEVDPRLKDELNSAMGISEMKKREKRRDLARHAHPQRGVDALKSAFPGSDGRPEGVRDVDESS